MSHKLRPVVFRFSARGIAVAISNKEAMARNEARLIPVASELVRATIDGGLIILDNNMQDIPELERHVSTLCTIHGITIEARVSSGGRAYKKSRKIHIRPVKSLITYFTALHEIGHIVDPLGSGRGLRLEQEYHAWDWAIQNALVDPNAAVQKLIHRCLTSYLRKVEYSKKMKKPTADHPLWDMLREMKEGAA